MATLEQYWSIPSSAGGFAHAAQTFTTTSAYTLVQVDVLVCFGRAGSTATVYLYSVDGDSKPAVNLATLGSITNDDLDPYPGEWVTFTGISESLSESTEYAIVIKVDGLESTYENSEDIPYILWDYKSGYSGGVGWQRVYYLDEESGLWTYSDTWHSTYDWCFKTYSEGTPSKPTNPTPANDATEVDFSGFELSWEDGGGADTYNVYLGTSEILYSVSLGQAGTSYTTSMSELRTLFGKEADEMLEAKIYWRVDATNTQGTTTGDEWNFDARPGKATSPTPSDDATDENIDVTLEWTQGTNASTETVNIGPVDEIEEKEAEYTSAFYDFEQSWGSEYEWRIDSVNGFGTTTGDVWSYTTVYMDPPIPNWTNLPGKTLGPVDSGSGEGVEGTDFRFLGTNNMSIVKRLVVAAKSALWYEDR